MDHIECVVIGAGVIGLAIARALSKAGRDVLIIDQGPTFGTETSARNSEVIHAGIYYEPTSLMAKLCAPGRKALYAYCESRNVAHKRCGKLIVATTPAEVQRLDEIARHARGNGVDDLIVLTKDEATALEPALSCEGALLSPSTGIIDSHGYMLALLADAEAHGTIIAYRSRFTHATPRSRGFAIHIEIGDGETMGLSCTILVNAGGLHAPAVAARIAGLDGTHIPTAYYAKGNYFAATARVPFSRLIYPVPVAGGLGVHLTLDLAGRARFGPDVEWIDRINYEVDPDRAQKFYGAIRRYWPGLPNASLFADYAGIRPKIVPPAIAKQDFVISGAASHGLPGLVNLFGIESPGLTASLAIADAVSEIVQHER
jgi:L-2-hydroxyglutarate oxidase LhgO